MSVAPEHMAGWFSAYSNGFEAGERSRPTDAEIQAWADEVRESAYRQGYADGLAVDQHRQDAKRLTAAAVIALDRARPGSSYIPRAGAA